MITFGDYEYANIEVKKLAILPQVRKIKNSKIEELVDSILDKGLINPIDVAKLTEEELSNHIAFINELWKKDVKIHSFTKIDGYYYVVIAGHTRVEAIKTISKQKHCACSVCVKIHQAHTSEEILAIQLDENIHSEPRIEERAIAIIETYRLGLKNGKWHDRTEFIVLNQEKFSRRVLSDAVDFSYSPADVQEYVFSNNIPFAVGVELGRIYPLIEKYELSFISNEETADMAIRLHYARLLMELQKAKSVKKALEKISSHAKGIQDYFKPKEVVQQDMLDWFNDGVNRQEEMYLQELRKEHQQVTKQITALPFEYFMSLLALDGKLTGLDHTSELGDVKDLYLRHINSRE